MLLTGASPAPNADSGAKAAGLTQHTACAFERVPLNAVGRPATIFARRLIVIPTLVRKAVEGRRAKSLLTGWHRFE